MSSTLFSFPPSSFSLLTPFVFSFARSFLSQALVTVHLKNQGPEAYRHDVYGDEIIVARAIHRTGAASTYKIKSSLGPKGKEKKTISSKRDELDRVLDHMNIQVS